ncbi:MAG TPA: hypothetical protein VHH92_00485 [Actinomycetota bacterium]|nr:hypothetical protein [Actinomycetota bacterium]
MTRSIVAFVVVMLSLAACDGQGGAQTDGADADRLQTASQGLCDAQVEASRGRLRDARAIFDAETHDYLHALAARLQQTDRAAAAELLEAKQRVEAAFRSARDPTGLHELLVALQRELGDAAEAAGLPAPLCREGAS